MSKDKDKKKKRKQGILEGEILRLLEKSLKTAMD